LILHIALVSVTAVIAYLYGDLALHWAYKSKFDDHGTALKIWIAAACLSALSKPFESWLLALGHARILFRCKAAGAIVAIAAAMSLVGIHGLPGILTGMVMGLAVNCILLIICRLKINDVLNQP
jgi:O-antigen/teichoic acid export membrane protein